LPAPVTPIGFFGTVHAIRASARLTSTERLVLLVLASHANNRTGEAWPSMPTLAAECGLTTRTIERVIAALVAAGWVARIEWRIREGRTDLARARRRWGCS
jgi:DNA-binding MarR family transcriptional regulator